MEDLLNLKNIQYRFPRTEVLKDISFSLHKGEFVSIIGPSGCGKSTLFNLLTGILEHQEGTICYKGQGVNNLKGLVGFMHQRDLLLPWRTIEGNLLLPGELKKISPKESLKEIEPLLPLFGLEDFQRAYPHQLSGGMRQRAALLRTYLYNQDFLLLDEPFGALDAFTRHEMQTWLRKTITTLKSTVLMITHDIDEALLLSDRVLVFSPRPASILSNLPIDLQGPRNQRETTTEEFNRYKEEVLQILGF